MRGQRPACGWRRDELGRDFAQDLQTMPTPNRDAGQRVGARTQRGLSTSDARHGHEGRRGSKAEVTAKRSRQRAGIQISVKSCRTHTSAAAAPPPVPRRLHGTLCPQRYAVPRAKHLGHCGPPRGRCSVHRVSMPERATGWRAGPAMRLEELDDAAQTPQASFVPRSLSCAAPQGCLGRHNSSLKVNRGRPICS